MKTHIALLRGINVGGNKKVSMADLRAFLEEIGLTEPRTLLQSGNLVFKSNGDRDDAALESFLEAEAAKRLGLSTVFLVRTAAEWAEVIARNPFPDAAATAPGRLLVMFFRVPPTASTLKSLHDAMISSERIRADGRQLYAALPDGIGNSVMANAMMSARFSKHASGRNWNMVTKLAALVDRVPARWPG